MNARRHPVTRRPLMAAVVMTLAMAGCSGGGHFDKASQYGPEPKLPEPQRGLLPNMELAKVIGWQAGQTPTVPQGFRIEAMASGLSNPRNVLPLPNGDLLVVESRKQAKEPVERPKRPVMAWVESKAHGSGGGSESNRVLLLRDANGDGQPESNSVLIEQLNSPFGIAQVGGFLYVAATDALLRFPFKPGDTRVGPAQKVTDLPAGPINHHWTKSLAANADGTKLYVGVGSNSNAMERGVMAETNRAAIWEVDPATGAFRVYASGLRNPNGLTFYPGSNQLWAVVNERDELGPNLVPDYMTSVRPGAFYGWPYSYWGQHVDPRVRPQRPDLVNAAISPDYALSSHVAPLGLAFYTGSSFPAQYQGGAFIGEHGSWNRPELNGYKVVFVPFANGRPTGQPIDFVTGFLQNGEARGRPVGVAVDRSGALIVADDVGNTVWRISAS